MSNVAVGNLTKNAWPLYLLLREASLGIQSGAAARGLAVLGLRESASLLARALRAFQIVPSKDPQG